MSVDGGAGENQSPAPPLSEVSAWSLCSSSYTTIVRMAFNSTKLISTDQKFWGSRGDDVKYKTVNAAPIETNGAGCKT